MKWVGLILTLVVGGLAVYFIFHGDKSEPNTARGVVTVYVKAAKDGDQAAIRAVCTQGALAEALRLAPQVGAMGNAGPLGFQAMKADPPRQGFCAVASGRLLGVEAVEEDGQWKIAPVAISAM